MKVIELMEVVIVMSNLIIREGTHEDLDNILYLQECWANEEITYGFAAADKAYLKTKLGKYFLVAELDGNINGFVYATIRNAENMAVIDNGQLYIEIDDIYVSPNSRRIGLGNLLLDRILELAKEDRIERSVIYSSTKDIDGIMKFYKRHDYKTWCIQMFK